ncbi:hypothetical protein jhhlp_007688 [Lomentospora prolificans]|uniref:polynucleotide adenylyltransferase n=1 Tax=Lomentospora prolificans TaxID=41688 RepID=A0A2N3N0A4_9PEZI|nr:hypothetical protein jhhlp_007688 [Lomentospora prolificans]
MPPRDPPGDRVQDIDAGRSRQGEDHSLEHRVRGLILSNTAPAEGPRSSPTPVSQAPDPRVTEQSPPSDEHHSQAPVPASPRTPRRRPNQAQRRQMSAQLTLPIDVRAPIYPPGPFSAPHVPGSGGNISNYIGSTGTNGPTAVPGPHRTHAWAQPTSGSPGSRHNNRQATSPWSASSQAQLDKQSNPYTSSGRQRTHPHPHTRRPYHSVGSLPVMHSGEVFEGSGRAHQPFFMHQGYRDMRKHELLARQAQLLDDLYPIILADAEIDRGDIAEKEAFRITIESICRDVISKFECEHNRRPDFSGHSVQLRCFGSLSSGFATKASDMDLGLLSPESPIQPDAPGSPIPRLLEKALLDAGFGARLLTRTRVPIIKLCERPPPDLLRDLRNEREKWENGLDTELADAVDDENHGDADGRARLATAQTALPSMGEPRCPPHHESEERNKLLSVATDTIASGITPDRATVSLHQAENQSLSAYYASAKRALRKSGGYDLSISNSKNMTRENCEALLAITQSFIAGLRDPTLRSRLSGDQPSKGQIAPMLQNLRTLLGIYVCAEGEEVLMKWENRQAVERTAEREHSLMKIIEVWHALRSKVILGTDSVHHARELQSCLEKMKKYSSVQLILLEQGQYESASHYADRAVKLLADLCPRHPGTDASLTRHILEQYVDGIYNTDIRQTMAGFLATPGEHLCLQGVFLKHKSLQLAQEFERALAKDLYPGVPRSQLEWYIDLLRSSPEPVASKDGIKRWVIPVPSGSASALATIRELPDPSTLAPNRPRDPYSDRLEFPKSGVGVQCDINFSAHLALQNTLLLRCYSHTDPRVRPMVLFIKHWAKVRAINSPYRGTLSSYGFVIMVLHFLINIAQPFVCPNLQKLTTPTSGLPGGEIEDQSHYMGRDVRFWRDEREIIRLAQCNSLNHNGETVGQLLRGFFEYYAQGGPLSTLPGRGFDWGREVVSIRTPGGILTKQEKGWTGAKTVTVIDQPSTDLITQPRNGQEAMGATAPPAEPFIPDSGKNAITAPSSHKPQKSGEIKEIRHRFLFAIEDPFEVDHNIARTVTHHGIVSIRDEFRRAWRIIQNAGHGRADEILLDVADIGTKQESQGALAGLVDEIHGRGIMKD